MSKASYKNAEKCRCDQRVVNELLKDKSKNERNHHWAKPTNEVPSLRGVGRGSRDESGVENSSHSPYIFCSSLGVSRGDVSFLGQVIEDWPLKIHAFVRDGEQSAGTVNKYSATWKLDSNP